MSPLEILKAARALIAEPDAKLRAAAIRYAEATAEIRRLTDVLAESDEDGPMLRCTTPFDTVACRKWSYGPGADYGIGGWVPARDPDEWCAGCKAVQEIVQQRRAAKRKRGAALSALSNLGRGLMRREKIQ